jgi:hypothetical protein
MHVYTRVYTGIYTRFFPRLFQTKEGVTPSFQREYSIAVFINYSQKCWLDVRFTDSSWRCPVHASMIWEVPGSNPHFLPYHHTLFTAVRGAVPRWTKWPCSRVGRHTVTATAAYGSTCSVYKSVLVCSWRDNAASTAGCLYVTTGEHHYKHDSV